MTLMNTHEFAEFMSVVVRSLPRDMSSTTADSWKENQPALVRVLRRALMGPQEIKGVFDVWETVTLNKRVDLSVDLRHAFEQAEVVVTQNLWGILQLEGVLGELQSSLETEEGEVDLVNVSVRELGFPTGAYLHDIYDQAFNLGLDLCTNKTGLRLALQNRIRFSSERRLIAARSIRSSRGRHILLCLFSDEGVRSLGSDIGEQNFYWPAEQRFIFALPRKKS